MTADIGGIDPCLLIKVRRNDVEQWTDKSNALLRLDMPSGDDGVKSYLVRVTGAQRKETNGRLIHICFAVADRANSGGVHTLTEQPLFMPEDESHRLEAALRDALAQDNRFAKFGNLWFIASACPMLTKTHIDSITAHLTAHPDGTTGDELLTLIPDYAAGATDAVRRFALNYRLLSVDAVHCISRAPSSKWMLRAHYEAERKRFAPLKVRTPRGSDILSPDELKPVWDEGKLDKALEAEAEQENRTSSRADQHRRSDKLTLTLSFSEWAQGSIHLTDAEAAFFCCDADEELTFADMTTGETFTVRFYRRRNDERADNLLGSDALNNWIHGNCLIPAAYVDIHRTENPHQFGIGWRRVEKTLLYRRREWNAAENRIERFTDTFTAQCDFDPDYFIEQERLEDILTMQKEAEHEGKYWQIMVNVFRHFDPDGHGLTPRQVFKYTDAVRAATRSTVYNTLSRFPCFQRGDDGKYRLDAEKIGRVKSPYRPKPKAQPTQPPVEVAPPTQPPPPNTWELLRDRLSKSIESLDRIDNRVRVAISEIRRNYSGDPHPRPLSHAAGEGRAGARRLFSKNAPLPLFCQRIDNE